MDKIRVLLITLIIAVSFYGVIQFGAFKQEHDKAALVMQHQEAEMSSAADDTPSIISSTNDTPQLISKKQPQSGNDNSIEVDTDIFNIKIDKKGGDITYIALKKYAATLETPDIPFVLMQENSQYHYEGMSGLIGPNGTDKSQGRPLFSSEKNKFTINAGQDKLIVDLKLQQGEVNITKRFIFSRDEYLFKVNYIIDNQSDRPWEGAVYAQIKRDSYKPVAETSGMGMSPYLGFALRTNEDRFKKIDFSDLKEGDFKTELTGGWIAMIQHYFLTAWIFNAEKETKFKLFKSQHSDLNIAQGIQGNSVIAPKQKGELNLEFYAGPKDQYQLAKISEGLDLSVDYGFLWWIAQPLYALLYFFNNGVLHVYDHKFDVFSGFNNWGIAIILLTLLIKLIFYSLNVKAYTSMARMRAIQPKMLAIKDRYANDRQKLSQETMALYKKEGVNPIGGCLPMLVQMPFFIALYWVLMESVELRHAPFFGWIHDLSAMDPYFILPLLMGISMFFQQRMQPAPPDPMQAKVMQFLPVIFTFFFLFFPAGLVLYWVVNNIVTILQQWYITKKIEEKSKA